MQFKVIRPIEHDLVRYEIGDAIAFADQQAKERDVLLDIGAIAEFDQAPVNAAKAAADAKALADANAVADAEAVADAKAAADTKAVADAKVAADKTVKK